MYDGDKMSENILNLLEQMKKADEPRILEKEKALKKVRRKESNLTNKQQYIKQLMGGRK